MIVPRTFLIFLAQDFIFSCYLHNFKDLTFIYQIFIIKTRATMGNIFNAINLLGWSAVITLILKKYLQNPYTYFKQNLQLQIGLLTIVQTLQVLDIILILIGKSKGSLFGSIAQITGRLIVTYIFLQDQTNTYSASMMAVFWGTADIIRYSYYLSKSEFAAFVRYHAFMVLYPMGVYSQMRVINDYIRRHAAQLTIDQISMIRLIQAVIILGTVFLYLHMLNSRRKYYSRKDKLQNPQPAKIASQATVQKKVSAKRQ